MSNMGLGKIITTPHVRDAIHVAIAPVVAGEQLSPGEHVGLCLDGTAAAEDGVLDNGASIGIVDPFLKKKVKKGEAF